MDRKTLIKALEAEAKALEDKSTAMFNALNYQTSRPSELMAQTKMAHDALVLHHAVHILRELTS